MRDGLFAAFTSAMLVVSLAPRHRQAPIANDNRAPIANDARWTVRLAWLAQRESVVGDWQAVKPPLREGDELQLTVLASEDACVYVFDGSRLIFPPQGVPPMIQAQWPYALPGAHGTWRLDGEVHDRFHVVAARHPLPEPAEALIDFTASEIPVDDLLLPLRDGSRGTAVTVELAGTGVLVGTFLAR